MLGLSDFRNPKEDFKTVNKVTGLSDGSIKYLVNLKKNKPNCHYLLDVILDQQKDKSQTFDKLLLTLSEYLLTNNLDINKEFEFTPISEQDIRKDYEKSTLYDAIEHDEYFYLFKISEIAKQMARKLKIQNK